MILVMIRLHSGSKAKMDSRNHGLQDPYVYVVCWAAVVLLSSWALGCRFSNEVQGSLLGYLLKGKDVLPEEVVRAEPQYTVC